MAVIIRTATLDDAKAIYEIELATSSMVWSYDSFWEDLCDEDRARYIVAEQDGDIVGFAGIWYTPFSADLVNIALFENRRGLGYGRALLERIIEEAWLLGVDEIFLEVRESNMPAIALYRSAGFIVIGKRVKYYQDPIEDAIHMVLRKEGMR